MSPSARRRPAPTVPSPSSRTARDSSPAAGAFEVTATSAPSWRKAARQQEPDLKQYANRCLYETRSGHPLRLAKVSRVYPSVKPARSQQPARS